MHPSTLIQWMAPLLTSMLGVGGCRWFHLRDNKREGGGEQARMDALSIQPGWAAGSSLGFMFLLAPSQPAAQVGPGNNK
jgi:hypothetical protein